MNQARVINEEQRAGQQGQNIRFKIGRLGNETGNSHVMEALNVKLLNYVTAFKISD